jgi:vacuolar protein sorting-associated protein 13D
VIEGSNLIVLAPKERGKRSQLWRIDLYKRLIHEGSSPPVDPNDPKKASFHKTNKNSLVLDIANTCPVPGEFTPLMLRNIDPKRALTQTWTFTPDGRLCCEYPNMCVHPRNGITGLRVGEQAVLGLKRSESNMTPIDQSIIAKRMRKGSGVLSVSVLAEGPTRVLRINDVKNRDRISTTSSSLIKTDDKDCEHKGLLKNIELSFLFTVEEIGLSIINHLNEELIYIYFQNSIFDFNFNSDECDFNSSIQNFQVFIDIYIKHIKS